MTRVLTFVEIDIDYCANTYGVAPCTASIPTTGAIKCFNSPKTCQDRDNYIDAPVTLRFAMPTEALPRDIDAIPSIKDYSMTPATVSLGKDLGERATLTVTLRDHPFADTGPGYDKYVGERSYNPSKQGTYWGKFRARHPYLRGRPIRLIRGEVGQTLAAMETRHYVLDSFDGPSLSGEFVLVAKDILKLADGDRSQAPRASNGYLLADITSVATSATLTPSGIGNTEYPASGHVAIGGSEICAFTRSGDVLTLTRGQLGTAAANHNAEDRVQLCLRYEADDVADIIRDLLVNYAGIDAGYIPLTDWQQETATYLGRVYTGTVCEPTSVATLVSELIEQAALALWWNDESQKIGLQVLRGITTDVRAFDLGNILEKTLKTKEQPDSRLSRVQTYYGMIDPLKKLTEPSNYRSMVESVDDLAETDYGSAAIKTVYSRWMPAFGRSGALRLNTILLSRFRDPPRRFNFAVLRGTDQDIDLAQGARIQALPLQDETGAADDVPIQMTQINPLKDRLEIQADEMLFNAAAEDLTQRTITVDSNSFNLNLRSIHDLIYPAPTSGITVTCVITAGIIVGSNTAALPALDVGDWPAGVSVVLDVRGRVQGKGGDGGQGEGAGGIPDPENGHPGGPALKTAYAISLKISLGQIWGGGGGGGGSFQDESIGGGGGGGQGATPGLGGFNGGTNATTETRGLGWSGAGNGGLAGQAGSMGSRFGQDGGLGGAAGAAIDGVSLITVVEGPGDIRGAQIN